MKLPKVVYVLIDEAGMPFGVYAKKEEAKDALAEFEETWGDKAKYVKYTRPDRGVE